MELYLYSLIGVMILTTVVLKGIFCWMHCSSQKASKKVVKFLEVQHKTLSTSKSKLVHMEIPMEDMERTSTPVPMEDKKKQRTDFQSDV
ncbi:hypothetical protein TNCT_381321 [Trichonephila clavata]|uniref:Uncharacterized protein n=1 Tax=Trichonephila clavata TaxID=2740835 RepID=A0A8X6FPI0_TRICU|nr:hypothetical protein TNCT_381321 [Trichonephila clavata]